jgi:hypothetical protein
MTTEIKTLFSPESYEQAVREMVDELAPRRFAIVQDLGDHFDGRVAAWGIAFDDRVEIVDTQSSSSMSLTSPDTALRQYARPPRITSRVMDRPGMNPVQAATNVYRHLDWSPGHTKRLVWIRTGRLIDALEVPRPIGERALDLLPALGPLFEAAESRPRWVFLTRAAHLMIPTLAAQGIDHITAGNTVDLPPTQFGPCRLRWLTPPTAPLTPFATVAEALSKAAR